MDRHHRPDITQLYNVYADQMYHYILLHTADPQAAKDLTQDTFIQVIKSMHSFEGKSSLKTWLYAIARNVTRDHLRKKKVLTVLPRLFRYEQSVQPPLPEEWLEHREETKQLYAALHRLKISYQQVIILRKIQELSIAETADVMNWSEGKVKMTMHRALKALKKQLTEVGYCHAPEPRK